MLTVIFITQWLMIPVTLCSVVTFDDYRKIMRNIDTYKLITSDIVTQKYFDKYNTLMNKGK